MTAQPFRLILHSIKSRTQVRVKAIVPDEQFVKLSAGGNVLVIENGCARHIRWTKQTTGDELHQFAGEYFGGGKEIADHREAVIDGSRARGRYFDRLSCVGAQIDADRAHALSFNRD